jgi:MFS family permease
LPSTTPENRRRWLIPLVVAFGFLMEGLDSTIITVAIPNMAASLHETPVQLSLAITSYLLSLAVFIPISGWIADRFGARSVICAAFAVFTLASALCGLSVNLPMLVATRVLQGIGGAMMNPVGRLILLRAFPRGQLVRAMSYVSMPSLIGPTLGPILGGLITSYASWRWIFYVNIPFGLLAILVSFRIVENVRGATPARFDTPGFLICGRRSPPCSFFWKQSVAGPLIPHGRLSHWPSGSCCCSPTRFTRGAGPTRCSISPCSASAHSALARWLADCAASASAHRPFCCPCCFSSASA